MYKKHRKQASNTKRKDKTDRQTFRRDTPLVVNNIKLEALREFKPLPRIFMFYSWLSVGIAIVNKESFNNSRIRI